MADSHLAPAGEDDDQQVTPWEVRAGEKGIDYDKLIGKVIATNRWFSRLRRVATEFRSVWQPENRFFSAGANRARHQEEATSVPPSRNILLTQVRILQTKC